MPFHVLVSGLETLSIVTLNLNRLSGPYRAMRAAMRCERRCVVNIEFRCDAMQKSWRCAFSLRKFSAMRSHDAKTLAMRCRHASHSVNKYFTQFPTRPSHCLKKCQELRAIVIVRIKRKTLLG